MNILSYLRGESRSEADVFRGEIWMLGKQYDGEDATEHEYTTLSTTHEGTEIQLIRPAAKSFPAFIMDVRSRLMFTYRCDFAPIGDTSHTCDIGWGCMLRTGQMMLANALLFLYLGRDWRIESDEGKPNFPLKYYELLKCFADTPEAPYGIHSIALCGEKFGKNVGEWFGPSTIAQVMNELIQCHHREELCCYFSLHGIIYKKDVERLAEGEGDSGDSWKPVMIILPLRLGLDHTNPIYGPALKAIFHYPQCVGIVGGRPRASVYFYASQGDDVYFLDPHEVQVAVEMDRPPFPQQTFHTNTLRKMRINDVDPSLAISFLCKEKSDFEELCASTNTHNSNTNEFIFAVEEGSAPNYNCVNGDGDDDFESPLEGEDVDVMSHSSRSVNCDWPEEEDEDGFTAL